MAMKILTAITFVLCTFLNAYSQKSPEYCLGKMPELPRTACDMRAVDRDEYLDKVSQLSDLLREEIQLRKEAREAFVAENTDKMRQNMASQMGMSKGDMEKLKNGGELSEKEAMAMAAKMMKTKSGISLAEAKNLGNMSEADKKAWAEGHSAELMAKTQANPGQALVDMNKNQKMFDLAMEQKRLIDKIGASESAIQGQLQEMKTKDIEEKDKLDKLLAPLWEEERKINDGEGSTMADVAYSRAVMLKIYGHQLVYCEKMTPLILDILQRDLSRIKASLPDCYRLQQIADEQMKAQTGVEIKTIAPDLLAMESLTAHINLMKDVFRFIPMEKPGNN